MSATVAIHDLSKVPAEQRATLLRRAEDELDRYIELAKPIIAAVARDGDAALARCASKYDGADLAADGILVTAAEFDAAHAKINKDLAETLAFAANNIRKYHKLQLGEAQWMREMSPGVMVGEKVTPVATAACYTPRGKGTFPSVTLMTTLPAQVAGVPEIVMLTPPGPDGKVDAACLVAARLAGVTKVAKAGGAQAVAAAAYGTESIPCCVKFEGPGSPWIAAAKLILAGRINSRLPAGPSESIVFADASADSALVALDLLIESEHGPDSSVFMVTCERELAQTVAAQVPSLWQKMTERCRASSQHVLGGESGGIVLAKDEQEAYAFINEYAPEHLQIMSADPERHLPYITDAAEILLGQYTPGSIANYLLGPNCVLPTAGAAKSHSPLGVYDFLKRTTLAKLDKRGYTALAAHTARFATYEGFAGHANAVFALRLDSSGDS